MPAKNFEDNASHNFGLDAKAESGYRVLAYSGDLGGGTLQISTIIDGVTSIVPDSKLTAATLDGNGDAIKQVVFKSAGAVVVALSGATAPNVTVAVQ